MRVSRIIGTATFSLRTARAQERKYLMDNKDSRINQILSYLAKAASTAADGVTEAMQSAGDAVNDKYSVFRLNIDLGRLQAEQEKMFMDIGRTMFMVKTGAFDQKDADGEVIDGQDTVDKLLNLAEEKQAEIDEAAKKVSDLSGDIVCPVCSKVSGPKDHYCSACGTKLPEIEEEEAESEEEGKD